MSEFENTVSEVQSFTGQVIETETVVTQTPLLEQGVYPAECVEVLVQNSPYKDAKPGAKIMKLRWKLEEIYIDAEGNERYYILFSKPYSICFGEKAALTDLCNRLTGKPPVREESRESREDGKVVIRRRFLPDQFIGMKCDVVIEHNEHEGRIFANIARHLTTASQKENNCSRLPSISSPR